MPVSRWPEEDWIAWNRAFDADDLLDGCNRATRMAPRTRITTETGYARWLVWLGTEHPACLNDPAGQRATRERVLDYRPELCLQAARPLGILAPETDGSWFPAIVANIDRRVRRQPADPNRSSRSIVYSYTASN